MALTPRQFDPDKDRIVAVTLDPNTITSINPDEVHEWRIAIYDLVEENKFAPARVKATRTRTQDRHRNGGRSGGGGCKYRPGGCCPD